MSVSQKIEPEQLLAYHPLAGKFPMMEGAEFTEFVEDIRKHGLQEPIVLYEDMILDGRNRYRATIKLKIKAMFEQYKGSDPLGFVLSRNLHRRHLKPKGRRPLIEEWLKANPDKTDREVAKELGASDKTVAAVRRSNAEIPHKDRTEASGRKARGRKPLGKSTQEIVMPTYPRDAVAPNIQMTPAQQMEAEQLDRGTENVETPEPPTAAPAPQPSPAPRDLPPHVLDMSIRLLIDRATAGEHWIDHLPDDAVYASGDLARVIRALQELNKEMATRRGEPEAATCATKRETENANLNPADPGPMPEYLLREPIKAVR